MMGKTACFQLLSKGTKIIHEEFTITGTNKSLSERSVV